MEPEYYKLELNPEQIKLAVPNAIAIVGANQTGKTCLLRELLLDTDRYFDKPISHIHLQYRFWQSPYEDLRKKWGEQISFESGYRNDIYSKEPIRARSIIVFDDLQVS